MDLILRKALGRAELDLMLSPEGPNARGAAQALLQHDLEEGQAHGSQSVPSRLHLLVESRMSLTWSEPISGL